MINEEKDRIVDSGSGFRKYADGRVIAVCQKCGKEDEISPEIAKLRESQGIKWGNYIDIECYKEWKQKEKAEEQGKKEENINYLNARTNAVNLAIARFNKGDIAGEGLEFEVARWIEVLIGMNGKN